MSEKNFPIPTGYFGIVLGLTALGLAWRYASGLQSIHFLPSAALAYIGETLLAISTSIWLCFIFAYIYKWIAFRSQAKQEFSHPLLGSFISLIPITTILVGVAAEPYCRPLSEGMVIVAILCQLSFATYYIAGMWRGTHYVEAATPLMYLPAVATNFVSATALGLLGYSDWANLFWGAGLLSWISLESAILRRLRTVETLAENIRPTISILLAPPFVGSSAYLAITNGNIDFVVKAMIGYGLLQFIFLARLLPWIMAQGFSISLWGFSFALASMAKVGLYLHDATQGQSIGVLGLPMFVVGNVCIALLSIGTIIFLFKGKFFLK